MAWRERGGSSVDQAGTQDWTEQGDPRRSSILAPLHLPSLPILPYNDAAMLAVVIRADHSFLFPLSSFPSCLLSSTRIFSMVAYENKM